MRNRQIVFAELKNAVAEERKSQLRVLHLLREVDADGHYLEMGYPSLFEFATQALGYSAGAAFRRIQSMRLLKTLPEMACKIEDGSLSLCVAAKTQSFFRTEDQKLRSEGGEKLSTQTKQEIAQAMLGRSIRDCEKKLAEISPVSAVPPEKTRELSKGKTLVQFSATPELMEKLERLKGLLAHQSPDGSYEGLFEVLADLGLKAVGKKTGPKPQKGKSLKPVSTVETELRSRHIPAQIKREVFERDAGACTYQDGLTGKRCGSRFQLEYDHAVPFARDGETSVENLRLRCRPHNAYTAKKQGWGEFAEIS